jgi:pimeloyl-ACP methyl ester carboxylesterase
MLQKTPSPGLKRYYDSISHASPQAIHLSSISLVHESRHGNLKKRFRNLPGKKFYIFGERSVRRSARTFLDSHNIPYFIVPGSGHFMMDDQPDLFYETLLKALENEI